MAEFNPEVPSPEPKNFGGYSQGISANKTFSTLFAGASALAEGAIQGTDAVIQENIRDDANTKVDQVRTLFGVPAATDVAAGTPADIQKGRDYIDKLKTAYNAGTIRESYYYGQLQSKVKELRAKYPGYEEPIDNIISDITGVTPANAIIGALRREADEDQARADAATNREANFINQNIDYIYRAFPDYDSNPDKYSFSEIRANVGRIKADQLDSEIRRDEINTRIAEDNWSDDQIYDAAATQINNDVRQRQEGVYNILGKTFPDVQKRLQELTRPGAEPNPEDMTAILQQFNVMKQSVNQAFTELMGTQLPDGTTYGTHIKGPQQQELLKQSMQPIDNMIESITNKDWGALQLDAAHVKASMDRENKSILEAIPAAKTYASFKELYGPEMAGMLLSHPGNTMLSDISTSMSTYIKAKAGVGGATAAEVLDEVADEAGEKVQGQAYTQALDTVLTWITDPAKATGDAPEKAVAFLFGPGNEKLLNLFDKHEQVGIYNKLVNPKVSKAMKANASETDWNNYSRWAYTNFTSLFRSEAADVQNAISNRKWLDVKWNPEAGQFVVKNKVPEGISIFDIGSAVELDLTQAAMSGVRRMNAALSSVKSVVDQDGGDMTKQMDLLIKGNMAINTDAMKEGSFFDQMKKAIKDWIKVDEPEEKPKGGKDESQLEPSLIQ
jgi:hypothetical protein